MTSRPALLPDTPGTGNRRLDSVRRYWPLFVNLTRRETRQRYKGSVIGIGWTLLTPAIMIAVYSLVFQFVFKIQIENYALFLFVGLSAWTLFFGSALFAAPSLVGNASLVTRVRFPRIIIPLSTMVGNSITALAMFAVAIPLCLVFTGGERETIVMVPLALILLGALAIGLGLVVAAANVYFRDVEHILGALGLPWIFVSPIFYTYDTAAGLVGHETLVDVLHYGNPPAPFIVVLQDVIFYGVWPATGDVIYMLVVAPAVLAFGLWFFRRAEPEMAVEL